MINDFGVTMLPIVRPRVVKRIEWIAQTYSGLGGYLKPSLVIGQDSSRRRLSPDKLRRPPGPALNAYLSTGAYISGCNESSLAPLAGNMYGPPKPSCGVSTAVACFLFTLVQRKLLPSGPSIADLVLSPSHPCLIHLQAR